MAIEGFKRKTQLSKIISEEDIASVHRATMEVLQETGVKIYHKNALKVFKKAGCKVDFDSKLVKFPIDLAEDSLSKCPSRFIVKSRNPANDLMVDLNNVIFVNFPGKDIIDLNTWESRVPIREEYIELIKVLDALSSVHFIVAYPYFGYKGIPEVMKEIEGSAIRLKYSSKVTEAIANNGVDRYIVKMAQATGSEIFLCPNSSSPLGGYTDQVDTCFLAAEYNLPCEIWSGALMGSSSPASVSGSIILSNAEIISYIILLQLLNPGAKVAAANFVLPQNMKSGEPAFGDVGISLFNATFCQVWQHYNIPTVASSTGVSNSKIIDFQLGYEKMMQCITAACEGANIIYLHSSIYDEMTAHPVQAILDDDIANMIGRFVKGVEVSKDSLAVDLINKVGPIPGQFLGTSHTRQWWRKEQYIPKSGNRMPYLEWINSGKKNNIDSAQEIMESIISEHKVEQLTPEQEKEVEEILKEARQHYRKKGLISDKEWQEYKEILKKENRLL